MGGFRVHTDLYGVRISEYRFHLVQGRRKNQLQWDDKVKSTFQRGNG